MNCDNNNKGAGRLTKHNDIIIVWVEWSDVNDRGVRSLSIIPFMDHRVNQATRIKYIQQGDTLMENEWAKKWLFSFLLLCLVCPQHYIGTDVLAYSSSSASLTCYVVLLSFITVSWLSHYLVNSGATLTNSPPQE